MLDITCSVKIFTTASKMQKNILSYYLFLTDKQNNVEFLLTFAFSSVKCRFFKNIHAKTKLAELSLL